MYIELTIQEIQKYILSLTAEIHFVTYCPTGLYAFKSIVLSLLNPNLSHTVLAQFHTWIFHRDERPSTTKNSIFRCCVICSILVTQKKKKKEAYELHLV